MEQTSRYEIINKTYAEAVKGLAANESILNDFESWYKYYLTLSKKQQITYTTILFDWQVKNGGFHQYFFNAYGIFCFYTVQNLREINCLKHADLLEDAISTIYNNTDKRDDFLRNLFYRKVDLITDFDKIVLEKFESIDNEYYQIEEENEINSKLEDYLTK